MFAKNYWQLVNDDRSKYSVGDEVEILYNPRKPWRFTYKNSWGNWIGAAFVTGMLGIVFVMTCWSWMRSPLIGSATGARTLPNSTFRPIPNAERNSTVSCTNSLKSNCFGSKGALLITSRSFRMTSLARRLSRTISSTISFSSTMSGFGDFRIACAVSTVALRLIAAGADDTPP
jgi:hypothetical protein